MIFKFHEQITKNSCGPDSQATTDIDIKQF